MPTSEESLHRSKVRRASKIGVSLPDDRYVPVRADDLVEAMAKDAGTFGAVAAELPAVAEALERVNDREARALYRELERAYDRFNPDRETLALAGTRDDAESRERLGRLLHYVFDKANYDRLDDVQLQAAITSASSHGMTIKISPEKVDNLDLYVRGRTEQTRRVRTWRHPFKGVAREVELYRRLAVVFRMHDDRNVNIKLFREIPVSDVEALLPHAEVAMTSVDRVKIIGGGLGALGGVAWKIVTVLVEGAVLATNFVWALVAAFLGLSVRSFLGYRRARVLRSSQMTHHLYYQNVANNLGVLDLLVSNIAAEETKEGLLVYSVLAGAPSHELTSASAVSEAVETWLARTFGVDVDFDIDDALEELDRLDLWEDRTRWQVRAPSTVRAQLEARARDRDDEGYHLRHAEPGNV